MTDLFVTIVLLTIFAAGLKSGALTAMALRPLLTTLGAILVGALYRRFGGPVADPEAVRLFAQFGLSMLAFLAAQQCRLSRLLSVSPTAFRLAVIANPLILAIFTATAFILVPGLDLWGTLVVGVALVLGGAPPVEKPLMSAPIEEKTRCAARLEGAACLGIALPVALIIEAGLTPTTLSTPLIAQPIFKSLAGFAVGGGIGLLAGRLVPLSNAALPVLPFLVALLAFGAGLFLGFDPVMTTIAAGLLYAEEAPLRGAVRTRLWRTGERWITPFALGAFGFLLGPILGQADFLVWVMALITLTAVRAGPRLLALQYSELEAQDRRFLAWFGGAPGVASALMLLSLLASPAIIVQDQPIALATVTVFCGILITRLSSVPLTQRLVQETALAQKKKRYRPA